MLENLEFSRMERNILHSIIIGLVTHYPNGMEPKVVTSSKHSMVPLFLLVQLSRLRFWQVCVYHCGCCLSLTSEMDCVEITDRHN